jgi:hypothetical protein
MLQALTTTHCSYFSAGTLPSLVKTFMGAALKDSFRCVKATMFRLNLGLSKGTTCAPPSPVHCCGTSVSTQPDPRPCPLRRSLLHDPVWPP